MPAQWKIVGTSEFKRDERPVTAFRLVGDVSTLTVPLSWPIPKPLERFLVFNNADKIMLLWQALVAQSEDPDRPGFVAFPETDAEIRGVYETSGKLPWEDDPTEQRPTNWAALLHAWYMEQGWYGKRDLVAAFGDAMEALTGLPLEQSAPLLHFWLQNEASGEDDSESKPASVSTKKTTAPRSGRRRTTSSPAA